MQFFYIHNLAVECPSSLLLYHSIRRISSWSTQFKNDFCSKLCLFLKCFHIQICVYYHGCFCNFIRLDTSETAVRSKDESDIKTGTGWVGGTPTDFETSQCFMQRVRNLHFPPLNLIPPPPLTKLCWFLSYTCITFQPQEHHVPYLASSKKIMIQNLYAL